MCISGRRFGPSARPCSGVRTTCCSRRQALREPTETYFGRVGKEHLLAELADVIGPVACKTLGAMKKAQRCALLTAWFADPAAVPTNELGENAELYRERMRTWLPTGVASAPR